MKDRNGKEVFLETHPVLEQAVGLYNKMGFSTEKNGPADFHYERTSLKRFRFVGPTSEPWTLNL